MDINIDFDGTCVTHAFPEVGKEIGAAPILKKLVEKGHNLILFTMRGDTTESNGHSEEFLEVVAGDFLTDAINWFKSHNIPLYGIQTNPTQSSWTNSPKSYGQLMIDDSALGCPLIYDERVSNRPYVDWNEVEDYLIVREIID